MANSTEDLEAAIAAYQRGASKLRSQLSEVTAERDAAILTAERERERCLRIESEMEKLGAIRQERDALRKEIACVEEGKGFMREAMADKCSDCRLSDDCADDTCALFAYRPTTDSGEEE